MEAVEIDGHAPALDKKDFLGPYRFSFYHVMDMGYYLVALGPRHVPELQRKIVWRDKVDPVNLVGLVDDNCDYRSVVFDGFNH